MPVRTIVLGLCVALFALRVLPAHAEPLVVTLRAPDGSGDPRGAFIRSVVQLALDKTLASHGPYQLALSVPMNNRRALLAAGQNEPPNLLLPVGPQVGRAAGLAAVRFPIHLGVHGYRVCFVHPSKQQVLREARSVKDLQALTHVQGRDWADVAVLRANGLNVVELTSCAAMFQMVAAGRVDLFCRSILEVGGEVQGQAHVPGLVLDDSLLLAYELPSYLHTHPGNQALIERLTVGLNRAYADGSLPALLRERLRPHQALLKLGQRRVIALQSPPGWSHEDGPRLRPEQLLDKPATAPRR